MNRLFSFKSIREVLMWGMSSNGHLYVAGWDFGDKSCQTRRKIGASGFIFLSISQIIFR